MPPTRINFGIRLPVELIAAVEARANANGQTKTEIVEGMLRAALGLDAGTEAPDVIQRLADVEQRLADVEAKFGDLPETAPNNPLVNIHERVEPTAITKPPHPDETETVPKPDGLPLIDALFAAGLADIRWPRHRRLTPDQIRGPNLNQLLRSRGQGSASNWLRSRGWESRDGLWRKPQ